MKHYIDVKKCQNFMGNEGMKWKTKTSSSFIQAKKFENWHYWNFDNEKLEEKDEPKFVNFSG